MNEKLIEAIARELEPLVSEDMAEPFKSAWLADLSKSALTAITEAGMVIVPREPTEAMKQSGGECWSFPIPDTAGHVYRAMISAAQGDGGSNNG